MIGAGRPSKSRAAGSLDPPTARAWTGGFAERVLPRAAFFVAGIWAGCGCAAARQEEPRRADSSGQASAESVAVPPTLVTAHEAVGVETLLEQGEAALQGGEPQAAERRFGQALLLLDSADPRSLSGELARARSRALFGLATSYDLQGKNEAALDVYLKSAEQPQVFAREANVRALRLLLHLERYPEAGELSSRVRLEGLAALDELAVRGASALAPLMQEGSSAETREWARRSIGEARELIERHAFDRVETPPIEVAVVFFAEGERLRAEASSVRFDPNAQDFSERLELRCRHLLDAQAAYSEVMRSKNAHWSAMAGVRVGELYFDLHRELMEMGPPVSAKSEERRLLYWGAIRLRYGILLDKAVKMLERTEEMLDRTGEPTRFRELASRELDRLREAQEEEEAAIDALPYSRDQLRAVLQDLSRKHGGSGQI